MTITLLNIEWPRILTNNKEKGKIVKKHLIPAVAVIGLTMAFNTAALGKAKEVTITGEGECAKCALHETKSCQTAINVDEHGKKVIYYLTQNKVSKEFHDHICKAPAKVMATGTVQEEHGKMELTPTKIELVK